MLHVEKWKTLIRFNDLEIISDLVENYLVV